MAKAMIINKLIDVLGVSISAFEKSCGLGNTTITKAIERNGNLTTAVIDKIVQKYPHISKGWLYTGEGEMFTEPQNTINKAKEQALKIATGNPSIKVEDLLSKENDTLNPNTNYNNTDNQQDNTKMEGNINDKLVSSEFTKNNTTMVSEFQSISRSIDTQAKALDKFADAVLIMAKTQDRLTSILEKVVSGETEGMHVKQTVD